MSICFCVFDFCRYGDPNFVVPGVDTGIVLASTSSTFARSDVMWPARICHEDETRGGRFKKSGPHSVVVVFLSPYWQHSQAFGNGVGGGGQHSKSSSNTSATNAAAAAAAELFDYEQVDASPTTLGQYPHSGASLDLEDLKTSFRLTGLSKSHFSSYVNAHRLALGLRSFSSSRLAPEASAADSFSMLAQLQDCHVMSMRTPTFPPALLGLPWDHVLKQLPPVNLEESAVVLGNEPALNLSALLQCMGPAVSLSAGAAAGAAAAASGADLSRAAPANPLLSTDSALTTITTSAAANTPGGSSSTATATATAATAATATATAAAAAASAATVPPLSDFMKGSVGEALIMPAEAAAAAGSPEEMRMLGTLLSSQLHLITSFGGAPPRHCAGVLSRLLTSTLALKGHGTSVMKSTYPSLSQTSLAQFLREYRVGCERIFSHARASFSLPGLGVGCCAVLTDDRCRLHLTGPGSFERAVRLPAAIKGATNAGAGKADDFKLLDGMESEWCELAKNTILPMCHSRKYLNRMRQKILELKDPVIGPDGRIQGRGEPLSDDSDGEGGTDTGGSKGSYDAAVSGVACALKAVDMVCRGQVVSAFCATRPPGHHAGTELRAMGAPSNGFCVFNSVAAAAK